MSVKKVLIKKTLVTNVLIKKVSVKKAISFSAINFSVKRLAMSVIGSLLMMIFLTQQANSADLTINISDVAQGKGHVLVSLFTGEENYNEGISVQRAKVKAENKVESVVFKNLADGEYAVKIYQDENDNTELDRNMMGIPKEGYGFSNNVGMFGTPKYIEAKFTVKNNTLIEMDLF